MIASWPRRKCWCPKRSWSSWWTRSGSGDVGVMSSLVSQREQPRDGQRKTLQAPFTDQCIIHAILLHVGGGAEHEHGSVFWLDNPHPPYADSEILSQFLPDVLPAVVR